MDKVKKYKLALIIIIVLLIIDQSLKIISSINWQDGENIIIEGVLSTTYNKNYVFINSYRHNNYSFNT